MVIWLITALGICWFIFRLMQIGKMIDLAEEQFKQEEKGELNA